MSEKPHKKPETTYYVKVEIGRHVPSDQGFYAVFNHKEMVNGLDSLKESIAVGFNNLANYMERRLTDGTNN